MISPIQSGLPMPSHNLSLPDYCQPLLSPCLSISPRQPADPHPSAGSTSSAAERVGWSALRCGSCAMDVRFAPRLLPPLPTLY